MTATNNKDEWRRILTTLPYPLPSSVDRTPTLTSRLLIRPLAASDLDGFHLLTTQHEVMKWTAAGKAHTSLNETRQKLGEFLPPNDTKTFNCAICLRATGEFIGIGGVHRFSRVLLLQQQQQQEEDGLDGTKGAGVDPESGYGWPELGYMFKKEFWGKGLATEFVTAFLGMWEQLQRGGVEVDVKAKSLGAGEGEGNGDKNEDGQREREREREALVAIIDRENGASQRILQKCGFEEFDSFIEKHRQDPDKSLELASFRYFPKDMI